MSKKGSLSLSVNAIVVLILAITMLGLGLGFMKGMFSKISGEVEKAIDIAELENPPTVENPMTMPAKDITLKRGEDTRLDIGYLNNYPQTAYVNFSGLSCNGPLGDSSGDFTYVKPGVKEVKVTENIVVSILLETKTAAKSQTNVCTFTLTSFTDDPDCTECTNAATCTVGCPTPPGNCVECEPEGCSIDCPPEKLGYLSKELFIKVP